MATKTLQINLADIEGLPIGTGHDVTGRVWAQYSHEVRTVDGKIIPLNTRKYEVVPDTGTVEFEVMPNDDPSIDPDAQGFAVTVGWELNYRANGRTAIVREYGRSIFVTSADPDPVQFADKATVQPVDPMVTYPTEGDVAGMLVAERTTSDNAYAAKSVETTKLDKTEAATTYASAVEVDATKYASLPAAITAAQALGVPAIVKGGRATYTLSAPAAVTASNITLDLTNSTVVTSFAGQAITFTGTSGARLSNVKVRGGRINLNSVGVSGIVFTYCDDPAAVGVTVTAGTTNNGAAVYFNNCNRPVARDVQASNIGGGIQLSGSTWGTVSGCAIRDVQEVGILLYAQSNNCTVANNVIHGYQLSGVSGGAIQVYGSDAAAVVGNSVKASAATLDRPKIRFRDATNFTCSGNVMEGPNGEGLQVVTLGDIGVGAGRSSIVGNTIRDSQTNGINVGISSGGTGATLYPVAITGNTIIGVRGATTANGISVNAGADAVVIAGNLIDDIDGAGIECAASASIVGNVVRNVGKAIAGKAAIFVTGGTASVAGNNCLDDQGTKTMAYGLWCYTGATARTSGNVYTGATSQAVRTGAGVGTVTAQLGESSTSLVGFYGTAPVAKPTGTPVAATDAATTQALVNDLRTKLIALGLIG